MSTYATMNKIGLTFFVDLPHRRTMVHGADTIANAAAAMDWYFDSPVHAVTFQLHDHPSCPPLAEQLSKRVAKLRKIAKAAGRVVSRIDRDGELVTVLVAR